MEIKINRVELIKNKGKIDPSSIIDLNESCNIAVNKASIARNILAIKKSKTEEKKND